ncbi:Uu.00g098150.m01.CDS01 [Anthostomella pinea]|uniref:Uu.00g098150.m01.CDS01 n=1 Tax=Anthostomella pinea TaxID=933095 RepID=A0AAI8VDJ9_9PEZI|nr:Uu.00g098150.m01.CDS01 [Anthostomella pinea]
MEPGQPETKRPRLSTGTSWSSNRGVSLPHPAVAHHPPVSVPHHATLPPYQPPPTFSRPPEPPLSSAHHHPHDERRHHHEHEPYAPSQDHTRQLPPSPAHQHYSPYGPRDPSVKRDPGEETALPQLRRPPSTGNGTDNLPPPLPHGHHPNHQHPDEPRRPMSFESGPPMPHSPALYRPSQHNSYHPPTPVAQHHQYDSPHLYGPPTPHAMYPTLEIQAAASAKRKAQRASQACDSCRQLKAKCDETKPCKNCREKNVECKYRDPPAKQPDKVTTDILELLTSLREEVSSGFATMRKMENRLTSIETSHRQLHQGAPNMKAESIEEDDPPDYCQSPLPNNKAPAEQALSSPGGTVVEPDLTLNQAHETLRQIDDDDLEARPGRAVTPGKPAIPQNHTTLAGLLLKWPAIGSMVQHLLEAERIEHVEEFPIRQEQARGQLRIFGRGEGFDQDGGIYDKVTPPDHNMDIKDDFSNPSSPAPNSNGQAWGQVGGLTPPPSVDYRGGVLNAEGNPDWDPSKVWKYVQSFKDNILNMHPIFIHKELDAMVRVFLSDIPKSADVRTAKVSSIARFITQPTIPPLSFPEPGAKRKRSPGGEEQYPTASFQKPGRPFRTIHNTLILLVLALGKICLHKDKIPDPVYDSEPIAQNSPSVRNGVVSSPPQGSPPALLSQSHSSGLPSPRDNERIHPSRRTSLQGAVPVARGPQSYKRNIDVIPGLEYFALATEIIGGEVGGATLKHVYVHLLAGLYHGQLGRVMDSWAFISLASQKLQIILRPSLGRLAAEGPRLGYSRRDNQLAFAFWTCLQLESDILAELPLPQSGILQYEERMPYPNTAFAIDQGFPSHIVEGYLAQLYLRKQLNKVHNLLYDPEKDGQNGPAMEDGINSIQNALKHARHTWVPPHYSWSDDDPLATDILSARLRAKYWGSQVILYRPFLKNMLNREPLPPSTYRSQPPPPDAWASLGLEIGSPNVPSNVDPRTLNYARLAIQALVESTRAFHGMDPTQRIIVTNVFGTAHAQWGNLLTLAACYRDKLLGRFIDTITLKNLFMRTIGFFQLIVHPTSALTSDMNILIGLARDLNFIDEYDTRANSSFSDMTSGGPLPPMHNPSDNYSGGPPPLMLRTHQLPPPHSMP